MPLQAMSDELVLGCKELFKRFNKSGDGTLSITELERLLKSLGCFEPEEIVVLSATLDNSGDGEVSYVEFTGWIRRGKDGAKRVAKAIIKETAISIRVKDLFARYDKSGDGALDYDELKKVFQTLSSSFTDEDVDGYCKSLDKSGDGFVTYREFVTWLKRGVAGALEVSEAMSKNSGDTREAKIKAAFDRYDRSGDGSLDVDELRKVLKMMEALR
jgi:Ca2+-binding EF-hand superfamily protein